MGTEYRLPRRRATLSHGTIGHLHRVGTPLSRHPLRVGSRREGELRRPPVPRGASREFCSAQGPMKPAPPPRDADKETLHQFGYAQQLLRDMGGFSNFAISFSIISILTGAVTLYGVGLHAGGPVVHGIG